MRNFVILLHHNDNDAMLLGEFPVVGRSQCCVCVHVVTHAVTSASYVACVTTVTTYLRTERPHLICSTVTSIYIMYTLYIHMCAVCCLWCQVEAVQQCNMLPPSSPKVDLFWLYLQRAFMRCIRPWVLLDCVHCTQFSLPSCAQSYIYILP